MRLLQLHCTRRGVCVLVGESARGCGNASENGGVAYEGAAMGLVLTGPSSCALGEGVQH